MVDNVNAPPTDAEVDEFIAGLSESDLVELKRQQLHHLAVTRPEKKAPDFGSMTNQEFEDWKMKNMR